MPRRVGLDLRNSTSFRCRFLSHGFYFTRAYRTTVPGGNQKTPVVRIQGNPEAIYPLPVEGYPLAGDAQTK